MARAWGERKGGEGALAVREGAEGGLQEEEAGGPAPELVGGAPHGFDVEEEAEGIAAAGGLRVAVHGEGGLNEGLTVPGLAGRYLILRRSGQIAVDDGDPG